MDPTQMPTNDSAASSAAIAGVHQAALRPVPQYTLPLQDLLVRSVGQAAAVLALSAGVVALIRPAGLSAVATAAAAVTAAVVAGLILIRPWISRPATVWPMILLACQGAMFAVVVVGGLLLYSALRPDPLVFGLVVVAGFLAALLGMVSVYSRVAAKHQAAARGG
ncbi:MAG: hypothetical protein SFZ24_11190 [Planctomycetota bacterium]|nr:hypothetical protein [Planctomycetota bacterium]